MFKHYKKYVFRHHERRIHECWCNIFHKISAHIKGQSVMCSNMQSFTFIKFRNVQISHHLISCRIICVYWDTCTPTRDVYCFTCAFHLLGLMVLVQQSVEQLLHMVLLPWFFINQQQVFPSQLVNSGWCERLSGSVVCHRAAAVCSVGLASRILATSHS